MKAPRLLLNLLFISGLLLCQCEKKKDPKPEPQAPQLPPETMEGKGTFGCLVNGEVWLPTPSFYGSVQAVSSYGDDFRITATRHYKINDINWVESVTVRVGSGISGPGTYLLNTQERTGRFSRYKSAGDNNSCIDFITNTNNPGILEITRWPDFTNNFIVSGRVYFTIAKSGCDTIMVTSGRFDRGL